MFILKTADFKSIMTDLIESPVECIVALCNKVKIDLDKKLLKSPEIEFYDYLTFVKRDSTEEYIISIGICFSRLIHKIYNENSSFWSQIIITFQIPYFFIYTQKTLFRIILNNLTLGANSLSGNMIYFLIETDVDKLTCSGFRITNDNHKFFIGICNVLSSFLIYIYSYNDINIFTGLKHKKQDKEFDFKIGLSIDLLLIMIQLNSIKSLSIYNLQISFLCDIFEFFKLQTNNKIVLLIKYLNKNFQISVFFYFYSLFCEIGFDNSRKILFISFGNIGVFILNLENRNFEINR